MKPNILFSLTSNSYFCILRNKKYYRDHFLIALPATCRLLKISKIENYFHISTYTESGIKVTFIDTEHDSVSRGHSYQSVRAL